MLIKGTDLTPRQQAEVYRAFVHRHHAIGAGKHYASETAWLHDHAFYFVKDGSRLMANRRHAEPHFVAA